MKRGLPSKLVEGSSANIDQRELVGLNVYGSPLALGLGLARQLIKSGTFPDHRGVAVALPRSKSSEMAAQSLALVISFALFISLFDISDINLLCFLFAVSC